MTGAKIPKGANVVIMLELTKTFEKDGKSMMSLKRRLKKGTIFLGKEKRPSKERHDQKGSKVTPGVTAILATFGYAVVPVVKTGDRYHLNRYRAPTSK